MKHFVREPLAIPFQPKKRKKAEIKKTHDKVFYVGFGVYMYFLIFYFSGPMY